MKAAIALLISINCRAQTVTLGCVSDGKNVCFPFTYTEHEKPYQAKGVLCNDVCENFTINYKTMFDCKYESEMAVKIYRDYKYVCFKRPIN